MNREELEKYICEQYGIEADHPFPNDADSAVFRHPENKKWFALFMCVKRKSLALAGEGEAEIVNLKLPTLMLDSLLGESGFLPAYHMNKLHWITALLGDRSEDADDQSLLAALDMSYDLTAQKRRRRE